jgi:hypothetical protein
MGAKTPLVLYANIPTSSNFQLQPEIQAGFPVSGADKLRPRLSPFVIRLIPPAVLQGIVESGGPDDPYSIRNLTIPGGVTTRVSVLPGTRVYGQIPTFTPDGINNRIVWNGVEVDGDELVDSLTPISFVQDLCREKGPGNNFGFLRNSGITHMGVDIYVPKNSPLYAPYEVLITAVDLEGGLPELEGSNGWTIYMTSVEDPNVRLVYRHLQEVIVRRDQTVPAGTQLGTTIARDFTLGDEGRSASHLHLEALVGGVEVNPFTVLDVVSTVYPPDSPEAAAFYEDGEAPATRSSKIVTSRDTSQQSQYPYYSTAANAGAADPYSNPIVQRTLATIVELPRTELQQFVYEGRRVTSNTPESPAIVDRAFRADILLQLQDIAKAPPLVMMINPSTFSVSHPRTQQFTNATRYGYIFEEFRQDIYTISASLQFGGFIAVDGVRRGFGDFAPSTPVGLQNAAMLDSAAWQQLQSVLAVYQNNGAIFDRINKIKSRPLVGAVVIEWDGWKYTGKFTSFSFTFDETQQNFVSAEIQFEAVTKEAYDESFELPVTLTDLNGGFESPSAPRIVSPLVQDVSRRIVNAFRRSETRQPPPFERAQESEDSTDLQANRGPFNRSRQRQRQRQ